MYVSSDVATIPAMAHDHHGAGGRIRRWTTVAVACFACASGRPSAFGLMVSGTGCLFSSGVTVVGVGLAGAGVGVGAAGAAGFGPGAAPARAARFATRPVAGSTAESMVSPESAPR